MTINRDKEKVELLSLTTQSSTESGQSRSENSSAKVGNPRYRRNYISGCYILQCRRKNCNLITHLKPPWIRDHLNRSANKSSEKRPSSPLNLNCALDGFPTLPNTSLDVVETKSLLHDFLMQEVPRIHHLLNAPSLSGSEENLLYAWRRQRIQLCQAAPLYLFVHAALAHFQHLVRYEELKLSKMSAQIYGSLVQNLRKQLDHFSPAQTAGLIHAMQAISTFDMILDHREAVENHRQGLVRLLHHPGTMYVGQSQPSVLNWDVLLAVYTGKKPFFAPVPDRNLHRVPKHPCKYGLELDARQNVLNLDLEVVDICDDICREIEIIEAEDWHFTPQRPNLPFNPSNVQYLYFLRDQISYFAAHLQAKDLSNSRKSRPILLATLIVSYLVIFVDYMPFYTRAVAERLLDELRAQDLAEQWHGQEDVLCWIMCVLAVMPKTWKGRSEAVSMLGKRLIEMQDGGVRGVNANTTGSRQGKTGSATRTSSSIEEDEAIHLEETQPAMLKGICHPADFVWSTRLDNALLATFDEIQLSQDLSQFIDWSLVDRTPEADDISPTD